MSDQRDLAVKTLLADVFSRKPKIGSKMVVDGVVMRLDKIVNGEEWWTVVGSAQGGAYQVDD